jgi:hypothetical protein
MSLPVNARFSLALLGALTGLGFTPLAALAHWASYAYSPSSDYGFASYQHLTRAEAEKAALQGCGQGGRPNPNSNTDCKVLASAPAPYWLVIVQTPGQLFWGGDMLRKAAEDSTLRLCRRQTEKLPDKPQCQVRLVVYPSSGIQQSLYAPRPMPSPVPTVSPAATVSPSPQGPLPQASPAQPNPRPSP